MDISIYNILQLHIVISTYSISYTAFYLHFTLHIYLHLSYIKYILLFLQPSPFF